MSETPLVPPATDLPRCTLHWHLLVVMAERHVRTASELQRRLAAIGVTLSSNQVARLVKAQPERLTLEVLAGLCTVLRCRPEDILGAEFAPPAPNEPPPGFERPSSPSSERTPATRTKKVPLKVVPPASPQNAAVPAPARTKQPGGPVFTPYPSGYPGKPGHDG